MHITARLATVKIAISMEMIRRLACTAPVNL